MSYSSPDREEAAYSDDDDGAEPVRSSPRWISPDADVGQEAPRVGVPRVICAAALSTPTCTRPGYSPKVSVDMASAHSWAPYSVAIRTIRCLSTMSLKGDSSCAAAREAIAELYNRAAPFHATRRFPTGEVYVCLDRAPLAQKMRQIQLHLVQAEVGQYDQGFVNACSGYISAIGGALDEIMRVDDDCRAPVLYDRDVFESAFLLAWTEP